MANQVVHPPAYCPRDGIVPGVGISLAGAFQNVNIVGNTITCPVCGGPAQVISGCYDTVGDRLQILIDPSISADALAAIRKLAEQVRDAAITPEAAQAEAERIAPGTGRLFDIRSWSDQAQATLLAAIIGATALIGAAKISQAPSQTVNVQPVIERLVETHSSQLLNSTSLVPLPPRKPPLKPRR